MELKYNGILVIHRRLQLVPVDTRVYSENNGNWAQSNIEVIRTLQKGTLESLMKV